MFALFLNQVQGMESSVRAGVPCRGARQSWLLGPRPTRTPEGQAGGLGRLPTVISILYV